MALIYSIKLPSLTKELKNSSALRQLFEELYQLMLELENGITQEYFIITQEKEVKNSEFIKVLSESLVPISAASLQTKIYIKKSNNVFEEGYGYIKKCVEDFYTQLKQCQVTSNSRIEFFRKIYSIFNEYLVKSSKIVMTNIPR